MHERHEMRVDGRPYTITVGDGRVVRVSLDIDSFMALGLGRMTVAKARQDGRSKIEGDKDAVERYARLLTLGA